MTIICKHTQTRIAAQTCKTTCLCEMFKNNGLFLDDFATMKIIEPWLEISNNAVCATSKGSDQPAHTRRLIRAFAGRLNIL